MYHRTDSSFILIGAGLVVAACSREPAVIAPPETRAERLAVIERLSTECQVPRAMMELVGEDELRLRPSHALAYERVDCVLQRIDQLNLPAGHVGGTFIGNEVPVLPETNNAQTH